MKKGSLLDVPSCIREHNTFSQGNLDRARAIIYPLVFPKPNELKIFLGQRMNNKIYGPLRQPIIIKNILEDPNPFSRARNIGRSILKVGEIHFHSKIEVPKGQMNSLLSLIRIRGFP